MKTKTIPFDLETAKKIQSGEVEGRVVQNNGLPAVILAFDINGENLAVRFTGKDGTEGVSEYKPNGKVLAEWCSGSEEFALAIELPEETPKTQADLCEDAWIEEQKHKPYIKQLLKLKDYTEQLMEVNQGVIDNLDNLVKDLKRICESSEQKHEFKPFDKVLVRDSDTEEWICAIFSHTRYIQSRLYVRSTNGYNLQCIPYEGNEHLVGTTDNPKEE